MIQFQFDFCRSLENLRCCYSSLQCWAPMAPRCGIGTWDERLLGWREERYLRRVLLTLFRFLFINTMIHKASADRRFFVVLADAIDRNTSLLPRKLHVQWEKNELYRVDFHRPLWRIPMNQPGFNGKLWHSDFFLIAHMPTPSTQWMSSTRWGAALPLNNEVCAAAINSC